MKISCLIPVYNEAPRIEYVLSSLLKVKNIDEIICVDDGSTDGSDEIISKFNTVKLIKHIKNSGKSEAIRTATNNASGEYVLLMDADLLNLNITEIEDAIEKFLVSEPKLDMLIFRRKNDPILAKLFRNDVIVTGERIIRKDLLKNVLDKNIKGYELEYAVNKFMISNNKEVRWAVSSAFHTMKVKKMSLYQAVLKEINMIMNIWILNNGFIKYNILGQMLFFHPKELR